RLSSVRVGTVGRSCPRTCRTRCRERAPSTAADRGRAQNSRSCPLESVAAAKRVRTKLSARSNRFHDRPPARVGSMLSRCSAGFPMTSGASHDDPSEMTVLADEVCSQHGRQIERKARGAGLVAEVEKKVARTTPMRNPPQPGGFMRRLQVGVIDLVTKGPTRTLYARVMYPNLASIMPQVVGAWCESEGHQVTFICYTGFENLLEELPPQVDLVFIGAFTEAAFLAYALSHLFRSRGAVTVLGGPHARCYPEDARKHFDYVL